MNARLSPLHCSAAIAELRLQRRGLFAGRHLQVRRGGLRCQLHVGAEATDLQNSSTTVEFEAKQFIRLWSTEGSPLQNICSRMALTITDKQVRTRTSQCALRRRSQRATCRRHPCNAIVKKTCQRDDFFWGSRAAAQTLTLRTITCPAKIGCTFGFTHMACSAYADGCGEGINVSASATGCHQNSQT